MPTPNARHTHVRFVEEIQQDARLALRLMRRAPGFTATIVLTLALGIGANAAIFGIINSLLLRPLPIADPHRLVTVSSDAALARGYTSGFGWTHDMWHALQPHAALFDGALAWTPARFDLAGSGERQLVDGIFASGGYFTTLGVRAVRGRTFTAADDRPGGGADGPVAVISHGLWQRRFGGAEHVIGAPLAVDGVTTTIVGVTDTQFTGVDVGRTYDVTLPIAAEPLFRRTTRSRASPLIVMLRLKADQSIAAATTILRGLQPELLGVSIERMSAVEPARYREPFTLAPAATGTSLPVRGPLGLRQSYERPLLTIMAVALLVLLLTCVNIANLLLARTAARRYELGVRLALGAQRGRLLRQLLIESLALAAPGAIGGFFMAQLISRALVAQLSIPAERMALDVSFD
ncbi:MAG: ABC transporter permease, partial [Vicinamibacterales bacterium]